MGTRQRLVCAAFIVFVFVVIAFLTAGPFFEAETEVFVRVATTSHQSVDDIDVGGLDDVDAVPQALSRAAVGIGEQNNANASSFVLGIVDSANRAPARPAVQLMKVRPPAVRLDGGAVECWHGNGAGAAVPSWAADLMSVAIPAYEPLLAATADEWSVLIGWVPSKFMGPQAPGRKASGQVMLAPTRGRNASIYVEEYNASWHEAFNNQGKEYHFQVVHRNAIRVCIRERLHLQLLYCSPSPRHLPIPVYFCPPRHSREVMLHKTTKPLSVAFPSLAKTLAQFGVQHHGKVPPAMQTVPPPYQGSCIEAAAAPWLVLPADLQSFPYEGMGHDLPGLVRLQSDSNRNVIVVIFNKFWIDHLHNFVYSMVARARMQNFIVATMDEDAFTLCKVQRLPCFDATPFSVFESDMVQGGAGFRMGVRRKVTEEMSWIKPRLAVAVLELGFGFFMIDLDITWNRSPMVEILRRREDIVHQCDSSNAFSINSGFYLARPNLRTIQFFKNLMVFRPEENSDQTAMKLFMRYDHTHMASHTCLDKWVFNMKCNYKVKGSVDSRHGAETFEWITFDLRREKFFWAILHATCLSGAASKMLYLRTMNAWFLDDLDNVTVGREYCLQLSGTSTVVHSVEQHVVTPHSEHYRKDTDDTFLKKRH